MRKEKKNSNDSLRPHYDLDKLEIVALGPGWSKAAAGKLAQGAGSTRQFYTSRLADTSPLFSAPRIDKDLLTNFFMIFARAEYALKEAKYFKPGRWKNPVIQWESFAKKVGNSLFASNEPAVIAAVKYLTENPPRRQVVKDDSLIWESRTSDNPRDPVFLIQSVTTVRNNLFHGGKKIKGPLAERDPRLLESCVTLLFYAISLDPDVLHFFEEPPREIGVA